MALSAMPVFPEVQKIPQEKGGSLNVLEFPSPQQNGGRPVQKKSELPPIPQAFSNCALQVIEPEVAPVEVVSEDDPNGDKLDPTEEDYIEGFEANPERISEGVALLREEHIKGVNVLREAWLLRALEQRSFAMNDGTKAFDCLRESLAIDLKEEPKYQAYVRDIARIVLLQGVESGRDNQTLVQLTETVLTMLQEGGIELEPDEMITLGVERIQKYGRELFHFGKMNQDAAKKVCLLLLSLEQLFSLGKFEAYISNLMAIINPPVQKRYRWNK